MKNPATTECRSHIVPRAIGRVLDVGIGSGLNLRFYGSRVTKLCGIDPSAELVAMARPKLKDVLFPVELLTQPLRSAAEGAVSPKSNLAESHFYLLLG